MKAYMEGVAWEFMQMSEVLCSEIGEMKFFYLVKSYGQKEE